MAEITAAAVKALRERTGLPMMQCKKALQEAGGDADKAVEVLKSQVGKLLEKRGENATEEGRIFVALKEDGSEGAMVEIQCESAPVAGGEDFKALGEAMVNQLLNGPGPRLRKSCSHSPHQVAAARSRSCSRTPSTRSVRSSSWPASSGWKVRSARTRTTTAKPRSSSRLKGTPVTAKSFVTSRCTSPR